MTFIRQQTSDFSVPSFNVINIENFDDHNKQIDFHRILPLYNHEITYSGSCNWDKLVKYIIAIVNTEIALILVFHYVQLQARQLMWDTCSSSKTSGEN